MKVIYSLLVVFLLGFAACSNNIQENQVTPIVEIQKEEGGISEEEIQQEKVQLSITDGVYEERVVYEAPPGVEAIDIKIEFEDNIIKDLSYTGFEAHKTSDRYQRGSEAALKDLLIGKNINEIEVPDKIAGSSLTTKAFKEKYNELIAAN